MQTPTKIPYSRPSLLSILMGLLIAVGVANPAIATTVDLQGFSIDVPAGWTQNVEEKAADRQGFGASLKMSPPDGGAQLKVISYFSPSIVDEAVLRNFTNVDSSQELELNEWGEFTGYQHSYGEGGSYYKQWWLTSRTAILILVYESNTEPSPVECQRIDDIVASLRNPSPSTVP